MRKYPVSYFVLFVWIALSVSSVLQARTPNIIIVLTDDQGYGDFGFMGNPHLRTPQLDEMALQSPRIDRFYVSPVCSPMRASLMTGRYHLRTGLLATNTGQSEMDADEVTLAEVMHQAGYFTGIYGKWHLGDHFPQRPQDQGFEEVLIHRGGGLGQPSEPPENGRRYTDPILFHNGQQIQTTGFCTDVYFDYALSAIRRCSQSNQPFFLYIATNAPHDPLHDVPEELYRSYLSQGNRLMDFPVVKNGFPIPLNKGNEPDRLARIYAMIENIDQNMGRLQGVLDETGLVNNTLVLFMSDNGPKGRRYMAGLRGEKREVYEGGIRSPLLLQWPGVLDSKTGVSEPMAHIDLYPTLLDAAGIKLSTENLDGQSFWPFIANLERQESLPDRALFIQSHLGNWPELYRNAAVINGEWKWVCNTDHSKPLPSGKPPFELFNLARDPGEINNVIDQFPWVGRRMQALYENWFNAVTDRGYGPVVYPVNLEKEPELVLTMQDLWTEQTSSWKDMIGKWRIEVSEPGQYRIRPVLLPDAQVERIDLRIPELDLVLESTDMESWDQGWLVEFSQGTYTLIGRQWIAGKAERIHQLIASNACETSQ